MRDLVREAGLPASTLRFYLREGLLPPPQRPTGNSAIYCEEHLKAARALKRLKQLRPGLALPPLKRALALIMQGVEADVALALQERVFASGLSADGGLATREALAKRLGVKPPDIDALCRLNIVVPLMINGESRFDALDAEVAGMAFTLRAMRADGLAVAGRIAGLIAEASRHEIGLRNAITVGRSSQEAAETSARMQDWVNLWHAYLFARLRVREVAEHGLGNTSPKPARRKRGRA